MAGLRSKGASHPHVRALAAAGVELRFGKARWEERFHQLVNFHARNGHFCPRFGGLTTPDGLYEWTKEQRKRKRQGRLPKLRENLLDMIGFPWESAVARNELMLIELEDFAARNGGGAVLQRCWPDDNEVAQWLTNASRDAYTFTEKQLARLRALGLEDIQEDRTQLTFFDGLLVAFLIIILIQFAT